MKKILLLILSVCFFRMAMGQDNNRPGWLNNKPKAGNSTYVYVVERGTGTTINDAVNNALLKVLRTTMMRIGAVVSWDEVNGALQQGSDWGAVAVKYNIPINKVCEYVERTTEHGFLVAVLCQVAKSGNEYPDFDDFSACGDTRSYRNGAALVKSALIPGLGQMGKRHYGSGIFTLFGEIVFSGGAVGSYYLAQEQLTIMKDYNVTLNDFNEAKHMYETYRYVNIACLSAAGALYVYNLVSAYTMTPKYKNRSLSFVRSSTRKALPGNQPRYYLCHA